MAVPPRPDLLRNKIQSALALHQSGQLAPAIAAYRQILTLNPKHPPTLHFLGVALTQAGQLDEGVKALKAAIKGQPNDPVFHFNLANAEIAAGRDRNALAALDKALRLNPAYPEALLNKANLLDRMGESAKAVLCYRTILAAAPTWPLPRLNLAHLLIRTGEASEALALIPELPDGPQKQMATALAQRALGQRREAVATYEAALAGDPDNGDLRCDLGTVLAELGEFDEARRHLEQAVERTAARKARFNLAKLHFQQSEGPAALALLDPLIEEAPLESDYRLQRALIRELTGDLEGARTDAEAGLQASPDRAELHYVSALLDRRAGDAEKALARLQKIDAAEVSDRFIAARILFERAKLLDRMERTEEAFTAFQEANREAVKNFDWDRALARDGATLSDLEGFLDQSDPFTLPTQATGESPIFLVGFPRSGTTLLDRVLDGHSGLKVMEEIPILLSIVRQMRDTPHGYPDALFHLSEAERIALRDAYLAEATTTGPSGPGRLVDKLPLNSIHLPLIRWLFPDAPILFALRHPMDCVLSCFMQDFHLNAAMANYLDLTKAARHYDRVMSLATRAIDRFDLQPVFVRYEDLVADFDGTIRSMLDGLDLAWEDSVLHYADRAKGQIVNTPSYAQVAEPIYRRASGRWQRYEAHLDDIAPILVPWIERWGYSAG